MNIESLPPDFVLQLKSLLGTEADELIATILRGSTPVSIRLNPKKDIPLPENEGTIPWSNNGYYLKERKSFTLDPLFHAGGYYVQEASSMLVEWMVRLLLQEMRSPKVLDLCGAPGGKSTLLQSALPDDALIVSNEVIRSRYHILRENLIKWGYPNKVLTNLDATAFEQVPGFFDMVLVDAPCSGEGLFRKDPDAVQEWSSDNQQLCAGRQKRILANAAKSLRQGGFLVYSTCTYNPEENEINVQWLKETFGFESIIPELPESWGVLPMGAGFQCFPHRVKGEGFYVACLKQTKESGSSKKTKKHDKNNIRRILSDKESQPVLPWLKNSDNLILTANEQGLVRVWPDTIHEAVMEILEIFPGAEPGTAIGQLIREEFIPAQDLIMSTLLSSYIRLYELDKTTALHCLKKEPIQLPGAPKGWIIAAYQGIPLVLLKNLGNRANNYYPKEWRIRMEIS